MHGFDLGSLMTFLVEMSSEGSSGAGGCTGEMAHSWACRLVLAAVRRPQFLPA